LNENLLEKLLDVRLPPANKQPDERYDMLLSDITRLGVTTVTQLSTILQKHLKDVLKQEAESLKQLRAISFTMAPAVRERLNNDAYLSHCVMVLNALGR
jgi:hypothetical protein